MKLKFMLCLLLVLPMVSSAQDVTSSFGYKIQLPDDWIVLTREEVRNNADLFDPGHVKDIPDALLKQVMPMISAGKIEIYFRPDGSTQFMDNVNIYKQIGGVPADDNSLASVCAGLPGDLAQAYQRPVTVYACELQTINRLKMLYLEFDGILNGTRNIQYQIPRSKNIAIVFTVTFKTGSMQAIKAEINQIIHSLELL